MFRQFVESIAGYPGLLAICAVSGIVFPLPEDFPLLWAGVQIAEGGFSWAPTLTVALIGVGIRDVVAYGLGRLAGDWLLESDFAGRWIGADRIERAEVMVRRRGPAAVLFGRFLIGFRAPIFAVAGACKVPFREFLLWDALGIFVAVPGVIWLGWFFGEPINDVMFWAMVRARELVALTILATAAWYGVRRALSSDKGS
jgi:membrane protein DedA with SNARE-associated domain